MVKDNQDSPVDEIYSYIFNRYGSYIKGETLFIGKAIIPIQMVIDSTIDAKALNPERDVSYIIDYLIEYFQT
jgi:hypothetical protein